MAQVYPRIANPYMPQGTPDKTNAPSPPYAPGEIGGAFNDQNTGLSYLRVYLDSGATSATTIGAVKAGQLAFWKDRLNNIVTNDPNFNDTGTPASCVNRVAGIFQVAVSTGAGLKDAQGNAVQYYCDLLIQGKNQPVLALAGSVVVPGAAVVCDTNTNVASGGGAVTVANATTAPTKQVLGYSRSSTVNSGGGTAGTFNLDVNIGFVD